MGLNQGLNFAFGNNRALHIEPGILPDNGLVEFQQIEDAIVQFPPNLKLQGTQRIINMLQTITDTMREIVDRIHTIFGPRARVGMIFYSVNYWVS